MTRGKYISVVLISWLLTKDKLGGVYVFLLLYVESAEVENGVIPLTRQIKRSIIVLDKFKASG